MFIKRTFVLLAASLLAQPVFADDDICKSIVKPCLDAGYTQQEGKEKQFWQDCMRPILLGKTVADVTVDARDVKACRVAKINQLEQELKDLKAVK